jgi:hypothetical protein
MLSTANPPTLPAAEPTRPNDQHFDAYHAELRRIARREARRHGPMAELSTTTLLHEAYLQMAHRDGLVFPARAFP